MVSNISLIFVLYAYKHIEVFLSFAYFCRTFHRNFEKKIVLNLYVFFNVLYPSRILLTMPPPAVFFHFLAFVFIWDINGILDLLVLCNYYSSIMLQYSNGLLLSTYVKIWALLFSYLRANLGNDEIAYVSGSNYGKNLRLR